MGVTLSSSAPEVADLRVLGCHGWAPVYAFSFGPPATQKEVAAIVRDCDTVLAGAIRRRAAGARKHLPAGVTLQIRRGSLATHKQRETKGCGEHTQYSGGIACDVFPRGH